MGQESLTPSGDQALKPSQRSDDRAAKPAREDVTSSGDESNTPKTNGDNSDVSTKPPPISSGDKALEPVQKVDNNSKEDTERAQYISAPEGPDNVMGLEPSESPTAHKPAQAIQNSDKDITPDNPTQTPSSDKVTDPEQLVEHNDLSDGDTDVETKPCVNLAWQPNGTLTST